MNPLPQGNTLNGIQFVNSTTGYAVGDGGTVLKSTDSGNTWTRLNTGIVDDLNAVHFLTPELGYAVGKNYEHGFGLVVKTMDGGDTWTIFQGWFELPAELFTVFFTSPDTGYTGGLNYAYKTTDGGSSWANITPQNDDYRSVFFTSSQTGYLGGISFLSITTDAGTTWKKIISNALTSSIFFVDSLTGFVAGGPQKIYKTTDAGQTWTLHYTGIPSNMTSLTFLDSLIGFGTCNTYDPVNGFTGKIEKTTDGGLSWFEVFSDSSQLLLSISFATSNSIVAVGRFGTTVKTMDQGNLWNSQSSHLTLDSLYSVCFTSSSTGYLAGSSGGILKTEDSGSSWTPLSSGTNKKLFSICFINTDTGFVAGELGTIKKTVDGGLNWFDRSIGGLQQIKSIIFPSERIGYILDSPYIYKTVDYGESWNSVHYFDISVLSQYFINVDTGYVVGEQGIILKTTDGGINWLPLVSGTTNNLYGIYFLTVDVGFAYGENCILKTINGGSDWFEQYSGSGWINQMQFTDSYIGYAIGHSVNYPDIILKTQDGGETWINQPLIFTNYMINNLYFTSSDTGYLLGDNGLIVKTTNGGLITLESEKKKPKFLFCYPNPTHGKFHFRCDIPARILHVQLFDLTGKVIYENTLFDVSGEITVEKTGLVPGMYYLVTTTDKSRNVSKILSY